MKQTNVLEIRKSIRLRVLGTKIIFHFIGLVLSDQLICLGSSVGSCMQGCYRYLTWCMYSKVLPLQLLSSTNYKMIFGLAGNIERPVFGTWSKPIVRGVQVMPQVNPLLTLISKVKFCKSKVCLIQSKCLCQSE